MTEDGAEQALHNWAMWRCGGALLGLMCSADISGVYTPEDRYREATVPILAGEASDVDDIVNTLQQPIKEALYAYYLYINPMGKRIPSHYTAQQVARELGCGATTYYDRLTKGRKAVGDELSWKRRRMEQVRAEHAT